MAIDWDALYELAPANTTYVKDTDDAIRSLKTATRERVTKEHEFDLTSQARQGLHRAGSAVAFYQASAPTQRNGVALAAADAGLLWVDSDDKLPKVWDGDSFEPIIGALHVSGYVHSSLTYGGDVFTALSPSIPTVGDSMLVTGGICNDAGTYLLVFSRAVRDTTTDITVYAASLGSGSSATSRIFSSGGGDAVENISMAW